MTPEKYIFADNAQLFYIKTNKFKTESLTISLDMPQTLEDYVMAHLLDQLLARGCKRLPSVAHINRELDELYSASLGINTRSSADMISFCIHADVISDRFVTDGTNVLRGVLQTAADMLLRPLTCDGAFVPETLSKVASDFSDSIRSIKNNPRLYATARLAEIMNQSRNGNVTLESILELIPKIDAKMLYEFYTKLLGTTSIKAFYVGAQSPDAVMSTISNAFSDFHGVSTHKAVIPKACVPTELITVREEMPLKQGTLAMGFRTGAAHINKDHPTLALLNEIFGGSPASKLFLNVREKMSLCYSCGSSVSMMVGNLSVLAGIDNANVDIARQEILHQLDLIRSGHISEDELNAARRGIDYTLSQIYDSPRSIIEFYRTRAIFGVHESIEEYKQTFLSVSAEDVIRLANNTVFDTEFYICGVGTESDGEDDE